MTLGSLNVLNNGIILIMTVGQSSMFHFNFKIRNYEIDCQGNYDGMNFC